MGLDICVILSFFDGHKDTFFTNTFYLDDDGIFYVGDEKTFEIYDISSFLVYPSTYVIAHYQEFKENGIM